MGVAGPLLALLMIAVPRAGPPVIAAQTGGAAKAIVAPRDKTNRTPGEPALAPLRAVSPTPAQRVMPGLH